MVQIMARDFRMPRDFQQPGRSAVYGTRAMVATSHAIASEAALSTLRSGGTAADAAITAVSVLCVVEPHQVSPAGDCFFLVKPKGKPVEGYNGSGRAAAAANVDWYRDNGFASIPERNVHAVTVPGAVDAWAALLDRHGRFGFDRVLARAIELAENGHVVAGRSAHDWAVFAPGAMASPGFRTHYTRSGQVPGVGDVHRHPALAETYRKIARFGARVMYEGEVGEDIVNTARALGSHLTLDDFASHRGEWVTPLTNTYRGKSIVQIPPNAQGLAAHIILNILETANIAEMGPVSPERFHFELEAARLGYDARDQFISEPASMPVEAARLGSKDYGRVLAGLISPDRRIDPAALAAPEPGTHTVYFSIIDADGMAVSFICSVFSPWGAGIVTEKTGLVLQNRGHAFRVIPGHPNAIGPGKRPLHTIIPGMVLDGDELYSSYGVMGGPYQACGHAHVLSNMLDYGMDPQAALDCPRGFFLGDAITLERTVPAETMLGLARRGHKIVMPLPAIGGGQVITVDARNGVLCGGSDHRKDGLAIGY